MQRTLFLIAALMVCGPAFAQQPYAMPGEEPVDPYVASDANAGAAPIADPAVFQAFHGREGVERVVAEMLRLSTTDPRISEIFRAADMTRLNRTLSEQFCYILGGGCQYTGRDMATTHGEMGLQAADLNILVEHLQQAMDKEGVPFAAQNKLLAKLAPMKREIITR